MRKILLGFFLAVGAVSYSGETKPGKIVFFKATDKSIDTPDKFIDAIRNAGSVEQVNQLTTTITQSAPERLFYDVSFPTNIKKLGTTKITIQIIGPHGGVYWQNEIDVDPELNHMLSIMPFDLIDTLYTGKPLPETITVQIIKDNAVFARGSLRIIQSGEIRPGEIIFYKPNDKSIDTLDKLTDQAISIVTQTKAENVFFDVPLPSNMKKLGTTRVIIQIIGPRGGVYDEFEMKVNPELDGFESILFLASIEIIAGKPLPETITVQIIKNGSVISRGNLRIIKDEK